MLLGVGRVVQGMRLVCVGQTENCCFSKRNPSCIIEAARNHQLVPVYQSSTLLLSTFGDALLSKC